MDHAANLEEDGSLFLEKHPLFKGVEVYKLKTFAPLGSFYEKCLKWETPSKPSDENSADPISTCVRYQICMEAVVPKS